MNIEPTIVHGVPDQQMEAAAKANPVEQNLPLPRYSAEVYMADKTREERLAILAEARDTKSPKYTYFREFPDDSEVSGIWNSLAFYSKESVKQVGNFIQGSYLQVFDKHLDKGGAVCTAHLKAVCNVMGKMLYGAGLLASCSLVLGFGVVGMLADARSKEHAVAGRMIGAYIGAGLGMALSFAACAVGAGLIKLSGEEDVPYKEMLALPVYVSLETAGAVVGTAKDLTTISLLSKGDFGAAAAVHFGGLAGALIVEK